MIQGEFHPTFRGELTSILLKRFQKTAEEGTLPDAFYEATVTLIPKPDRDTTHTQRKFQADITDERRCRNLNKVLANRIQHTFKGLSTMIKWDLRKEASTSATPSLGSTREQAEE